MATTKKRGAAGRRTGRPPDPPPGEMRERIQSYMDECEAGGRFPTESGMFLYLGLIGDKLNRYLAKADYADVWEWAKYKRIDWLENQMVTNPRCANGCMNALKQEKNGGYADRSLPDSRPKQLKINLTGVGGKGAAE